MRVSYRNHSFINVNRHVEIPDDFTPQDELIRNKQDGRLLLEFSLPHGFHRDRRLPVLNSCISGLSHVFISFTLTTAPVSLFFASVSKRSVCFLSNVYRILFDHGFVINPADLQLFLTIIYLSVLVIVSRNIGLSVYAKPVHVEHNLIWSVVFHVTPGEFHGPGTCHQQGSDNPRFNAWFCLSQTIRIIV